MNFITELHTELFSKQYYDCIEKFATNDFETAKILGQYYTNIDVAKKMITSVIDNFDFEKHNSSIKIIEPFCGDGRLVVLFIELLSERNMKDIKLNITIWDIFENNAIESERNILKVAKEKSINVEITKDIADSYVIYGQYINKFDICITNPPWGILKPQKIFKDNHTKKEIEDYKVAISTYDNYVKQEFYLSQPTSKFGKWGTNLSRCGVEIAIRLVKKDGICAFVSPASLLSDQVSTPLRHWIFENHCIFNINYYPAEAKLYGSADTSSITVILKKRNNINNPVVDIHDKVLNCTSHQLENDEFNYIRKQGYNFPFEVGISKILILMKFEEMKSVEYYSHILGLKFTREIDETRINEKLLDTGNVVFIKGYMIDRYRHDINPKQFINTSIVSVPDSVNYNKIVWRDVARSSSKRTMKATIVPSGLMAGNSLGVAYFEKNNIDMLKSLIVIMNSFIFEFQARALLVTNHISSGTIKKIKIPCLDESIKILAEMYDMFMASNQISEQDLECIVASLYGFNEEEFYEVLSVFKLESEEEKLLKEKAKKYLTRESRLKND